MRFDSAFYSFEASNGFVSQSFPNRTEGSVKKHWYKVTVYPTSRMFSAEMSCQDMHYAEFSEDEVRIGRYCIYP